MKILSLTMLLVFSLQSVLMPQMSYGSAISKQTFNSSISEVRALVEDLQNKDKNTLKYNEKKFLRAYTNYVHALDNSYNSIINSNQIGPQELNKEMVFSAIENYNNAVQKFNLASNEYFNSNSLPSAPMLPALTFMNPHTMGGAFGWAVLVTLGITSFLCLVKMALSESGKCVDYRCNEKGCFRVVK